MPPWPHEDSHRSRVDRATQPLPPQHGLDGKFVVMYSGNHSPANPLTTLLDAAVRLKDDATIRFLFVGGGLGKKRGRSSTSATHGLTNAISLPYQPLAESALLALAPPTCTSSRSATNMVGIIHPCKIYGAMAVGRPILFFGPQPSHMSDLLDEHDIGWHVAHGDVEAAMRAIEIDPADAARERSSGWASTAQRVLQARHRSERSFAGGFCDHLEHNVPLAQSADDSPVAMT